MSKFSEGGGAILHSTVLITLSTLAAKDVIAVADEKIDAAQEQGFRVLKAQSFIAVTGLTATEGPVLIGASGPGMNAAEIEECLEANPALSTDISASEEAMRPIWPLGMKIGTLEQVLNNGNFIEWKPRWSWPEGTVLNWWVYNISTGALQTGGLVHIQTKFFGVWLRD